MLISPQHAWLLGLVGCVMLAASFGSLGVTPGAVAGTAEGLNISFRHGPCKQGILLRGGRGVLSTLSSYSSPQSNVWGCHGPAEACSDPSIGTISDRALPYPAQVCGASSASPRSLLPVWHIVLQSCHVGAETLQFKLKLFGRLGNLFHPRCQHFYWGIFFLLSSNQPLVNYS